MNIKGKKSRTNTDIATEIKKFIKDLLDERKKKPDHILMKTRINLTRFLNAPNPSIACFDSIAKGFGFEDGHEMWGEMKKRKKEKENKQPPITNI